MFLFERDVLLLVNQVSAEMKSFSFTLIGFCLEIICLVIENYILLFD